MSLRQVVRYDSSGTYLGAIGEYGTGDGQFRYPYQLAFAPGGDLYVIDYVNNNIQWFSTGDGGSTWSFAGRFGASGSGDGQLGYPYGLAISPVSGNIYVADTYNYRVQYFGGPDVAPADPEPEPDPEPDPISTPASSFWSVLVLIGLSLVIAPLLTMRSH